MPKNDSSTGWLTDLVLNVALLVPSENPAESNLISMGFYDGLNGQYEIFGLKSGDNPNPLPIAQTSVFRVYAAKLPSSQFGLMKIVNSSERNNVLNNEALTLKKLQRIAHELDQEAISKNETPAFYGSMFPKLIEKIDAGDRTALFLGYHENINSYKQLTPLSVITATERVDLKSVQWIFGKLLKLLYFVHSFDLTVGLVNADNELVETALHGVFILDFSNTKGDPSYADKIREVVAAAKIAWEAAGGTEKSNPPYDSEIMSKDAYDKYVSFLRRIMDGDAKAAGEEFDDLYKLSDEIWPKEPTWDGKGLKRQFHEFRTYPR